MNTNGEAMCVLPNYQNAVIPLEKFTRYALCLTHDLGVHKAIVFEEVLGYTTANAKALIANIRGNVDKFPCIFKGTSAFGDVHEVVMELKGQNGRKAPVVTAWIIVKGTDYPRLTSAYVDKFRG